MKRREWKHTGHSHKITSDSAEVWQPVHSSRRRHTTAKAPDEELSNPSEWLEDFASSLLPSLSRRSWRTLSGILFYYLLSTHLTGKTLHFNSPLTANIWLRVSSWTWEMEQCPLWRHKRLTLPERAGEETLPLLLRRCRWGRTCCLKPEVISGLAGWIMWPSSWRPLKHIGIYGPFRPSYRQPLNGLVKPLSGGNVQIAASITQRAAFPLQYNLIVPVLIEPVGSAATC